MRICTSCHKPAEKTAAKAELNTQGFELCLTCHGDFPERMQKGKMPAPQQKRIK